MIFKVHRNGVKEYDIKQVPSFAFIPETVSNPQQGYLWLEFYNKVYEYRNSVWHFEGKLHKKFTKAEFTNNEGQVVKLTYEEASFSYKLMYFARYLLILLLWIGVVYGVIYFLHNYLK